MRLIDADKIKYTEYVNGDITVSKEEIEKQPTVEERTVAHWEYVQPYDDCGDVYSCTNCGYQDVFASVCEVPYCWHCGAKMIKEEKQNER